MDYKIPSATFDVFVDDELRATFDAHSRGEARRIAGERIPEIRSVAYQGRVRMPVRDHEHAPAAGNISVCVFCQERITDKEQS